MWVRRHCRRGGVAGGDVAHGETRGRGLVAGILMVLVHGRLELRLARQRQRQGEMSWGRGRVWRVNG